MYNASICVHIKQHAGIFMQLLPKCNPCGPRELNYMFDLNALSIMRVEVGFQALQFARDCLCALERLCHHQDADCSENDEAKSDGCWKMPDGWQKWQRLAISPFMCGSLPKRCSISFFSTLTEIDGVLQRL
jgi:hypothetical protein